MAGTEKLEKSNKKGSILFKFEKAGFQTIEVHLPNGDIQIHKDVEVKEGKTKTLVIFV